MRRLETRKTTRPKKVENGASARLPNLTSASCDLDLWPSDPQTWSFHTLGTPTTCTNLHQNRFIYFQNKCVYQFGNGWTDGRTDGQVENVMPPASITKTSRSYTVYIKNSQYNLLASHLSIKLYVFLDKDGSFSENLCPWSSLQRSSSGNLLEGQTTYSIVMPVCKKLWPRLATPPTKACSPQWSNVISLASSCLPAGRFGPTRLLVTLPSA